MMHPSIRSLSRLLALGAVVLALGACASTPDGSGESPKNAAAYNVQLGLAYLRKGRLALAKDKIERAYQQDPRSADVHGALGLLNERLGKHDKADEHYRTALRISPSDPEMQNNYAVFLCRNGHVKEGVRRFLEAAGNPLYRTPEAAYTNAGVCLRSDGQLDEAARNFARALTVQPAYAEAIFQLGDLRLDQGSVAEARTLADQYLDRYAATPEVLYLAVRAARASGDRVAEQRLSRRLRVDFPESDQARLVGATGTNPG